MYQSLYYHLNCPVKKEILTFIWWHLDKGSINQRKNDHRVNVRDNMSPRNLLSSEDWGSKPWITNPMLLPNGWWTNIHVLLAQLIELKTQKSDHVQSQGFFPVFWEHGPYSWDIEFQHCYVKNWGKNAWL